MEFSLKKIALAVISVLTFIVAIVFLYGMYGYCELQEFHVWQGVSGNVGVIDTTGYYNNNFGKSWQYPKTIQKAWKSPERDKDGKSLDPSIADDSIRVTFNDAGTGQISTFVQVSLPTDSTKRIQLQEKFSGNPDNILNAVHAHLTNCVKNTGPLMSATENQASRKAEFTQVVEEQLKNGLYQMRRTRVQLRDRTDEKGQPIWVEANEIILDAAGVAVRQEISPLKEYGITVNQFSITETHYDELTIAQFKAKQEAFLAAERSKAQREQEIQQKLYIMAQGERQVAEIEAEANKVKAKAVTEGQQKVEVAAKAELEAETLGAQKVALAELDKKEAETRAAKEAEVAGINADQQKLVLVTQATAAKDAASLQAEADKLKATGIVALAEAEQKKIQLAGAVKESDRVLATIAADRDTKVAQSLAGISVPQNIIISGGTGTNSGATIDPFLFNLNLLRGAGIMDFTKVTPSPAK